MIGVDAAVLAVRDERLKVGVYHYALNLLLNLSKADKKNKYTLYSFDPISQNLLDKFGTNWTNLVCKPKKGWLSFRLSWELWLKKPDIFLGLGQALPIYHPARNIVFVYDLAFEIYPRFYPGSYKRLSRQTKFAVKQADKIIAISKAAKDDLVRIYGVKAEKIEVIYPGIRINTSASWESESILSPERSPSGHLSGVLPSLSLAKPYFLFVGSYKPGKNVSNIIHAFNLFSKTSKKPYQLILAGSDYWGDVIDSNNKEIIKLGYVREEDLPRLYREAIAFVSPSYWEGFGMPILEAMAAGVPVIASNRGSIPEVTENSAILVDPDDIEALSSAMGKIATDEQFKKDMIKKGQKQAQKFSWERSAMKLLQMIKGMDPGSSPG